MRLFLVALFALLPFDPVSAGCTGQDQIVALPADTRDALQAAADAAPFARGNFWRAMRGDQVVTLLGTMHVDDPRFDAVVTAAAPALESAHVLLVEAGPKEQADLQAAIATDPSLVFITEGPTLADLLPPDSWQSLKTGLAERNIPGFMGAKMQPAYLSMILSIPPCATEMLQGGGNGLDQRLIAHATGAGVPVRGLEPFDTVFHLVNRMPQADQLDMLRTAIAFEDEAADGFATLLDTYFSENTRMMWEFSLWQAGQTPGMDPEQARAEAAQMDELLMAGRNRTWIPVIESAAKEGPVFAAFGALHLAGPDGVLALLERDGFSIERLPFPVD